MSREGNQLGKEWGLAVLGLLVGFFINLASDAFYDLMHVFTWLEFWILIASTVVSIFLGGFVGYILFRIDELKRSPEISLGTHFTRYTSKIAKSLIK